MAHRPAHLPRTEADLADWSVYADQLMVEDNPLGELIALDLSLPAQPTDEQRWDFAKRARERCWYQQERIGASWTLGYIRELTVRSPPYVQYSGPGGMLDEMVIDSLSDVIDSSEAALLESFQLSIQQVTRRASALTRSPSIWTVLKKLPVTCTRFVGPGTSDLLAKYKAALPTHVIDVDSLWLETSAELVPVRMQLARR